MSKRDGAEKLFADNLVTFAQTAAQLRNNKIKLYFSEFSPNMILSPDLRAEIVQKRIQTKDGLREIGVDAEIVPSLLTFINNFVQINLKL